MANISCFLGVPDANYIPALTAKNKRLEAYQSNDSIWLSIRALLMFFHYRQYLAYLHDCTYDQTKFLRVVLTKNPILYLLTEKIESGTILFIQSVLHPKSQICIKRLCLIILFV